MECSYNGLSWWAIWIKERFKAEQLIRLYLTRSNTIWSLPKVRPSSDPLRQCSCIVRSMIYSKLWIPSRAMASIDAWPSPNELFLWSLSCLPVWPLPCSTFLWFPCLIPNYGEKVGFSRCSTDHIIRHCKKEKEKRSEIFWLTKTFYCILRGAVLEFARIKTKRERQWTK